MQSNQLSFYKPYHSLLMDREQGTTSSQDQSMQIGTVDYPNARPKQQLLIHKSFVLNNKNDFMIGSEKQYLSSLFRNVAIKSIAKEKLHTAYGRTISVRKQPSSNASPIVTIHKIYPNQLLSLAIEGKGEKKPIKKQHSSMAAKHRQVKNITVKADNEYLMKSLLINEVHNECKPNAKRSRNFSSSTIKILSMLNKKMCVEFRKTQTHKFQKTDDSSQGKDYKQVKLHLLGTQYKNKLLQSRKAQYKML